MSKLSTLDIVRAWKSPEFRASLSDADRHDLPENPAGEHCVELDAGALSQVAGGVAYSSTWNNNGCDISGKSHWSCGAVCTVSAECGGAPCGSWVMCKAAVDHADVAVTLDAAILLAATGTMSEDLDVTKGERDKILARVAHWQQDPTLQPHEIDAMVNKSMEVLPNLPDEQQQIFLSVLEEMQATGEITDDQLLSLSEFADGIRK